MALDDPLEALDAADLQAVVRGDRRAFERLYRRHHPRLARFLRRFTSRADVIDDVVNGTFLVVWRSAAEFRGASKVATWITGIAYRCMLKALRDTVSADEIGTSAQSERQAMAYDSASTDPSVDRDRRDWIDGGLRTLPDDQRVTLELAYFMGQSCDEIAAVMGCAVGTVKARMFHARVRLRSVLPALAGDVAMGTKRGGS